MTGRLIRPLRAVFALGLAGGALVTSSSVGMRICKEKKQGVAR